MRYLVFLVVALEALTACGKSGPHSDNSNDSENNEKRLRFQTECETNWKDFYDGFHFSELKYKYSDFTDQKTPQLKTESSHEDGYTIHERTDVKLSGTGYSFNGSKQYSVSKEDSIAECVNQALKNDAEGKTLSYSPGPSSIEREFPDAQGEPVEAEVTVPAGTFKAEVFNWTETDSFSNADEITTTKTLYRVAGYATPLTVKYVVEVKECLTIGVCNEYRVTYEATSIKK
jgi:hypothetical protein